MFIRPLCGLVILFFLLAYYFFIVVNSLVTRKHALRLTMCAPSTFVLWRLRVFIHHKYALCIKTIRRQTRDAKQRPRPAMQAHKHTHTQARLFRVREHERPINHRGLHQKHKTSQPRERSAQITQGPATNTRRAHNSTHRHQTGG